MSWLVKTVITISLIIYAVESKVNDPPKQPPNILNDMELLSDDRPTKICFNSTDQPNGTVEAIIERLDTNALTSRLCSFPAFNQDEAAQHFKLHSYYNGIEVLQIIKMHYDSTKSSMVFFVINMTDCNYTKTEFLEGYDFVKSSGVYVVARPWDTEFFDIIWFHGENKCGTYMCKSIFNIKNATADQPTKFSLAIDSVESIIFMSGSVDGGYFTAIRKPDSVNILSLTSNGTVIKSKEKTYDSHQTFLSLQRMSTFNGLMSSCGFIQDNLTIVFCIQFDKSLNTILNITMDIGYISENLAIHNLPHGGLLLLTIRDNGTNETIDKNQYEFTVRKIDVDGFNSVLTKFIVDNCTFLKWDPKIIFYEENRKYCFFYICVKKSDKEDTHHRVIESTCI